MWYPCAAAQWLSALGRLPSTHGGPLPIRRVRLPAGRPWGQLRDWMPRPLRRHVYECELPHEQHQRSARLAERPAVLQLPGVPRSREPPAGLCAASEWHVWMRSRLHRRCRAHLQCLPGGGRASPGQRGRRTPVLLRGHLRWLQGHCGDCALPTSCGGSLPARCVCLHGRILRAGGQLRDCLPTALQGHSDDRRLPTGQHQHYRRIRLGSSAMQPLLPRADIAGGAGLWPKS
mmetsp:Transcript_58602/g.139518  ORF Transcript_58602/g.139518 Transcript_58602/m.139518 type:complete len:232 (+) Transcript_58602:342-1037(+)